MYPHLAHSFLDGGYVRSVSTHFGFGLVNPRKFAGILVDGGKIQTWAYNPVTHPNTLLARITYYDALPNPGQADPALEEYWRKIELLDDVHLGFGAIKGLGRKARQKGVDTLIAVDMLVGAFSGLFDVALLVAGDADFVPVVEEVKRRGVMVALAAERTSVADELIRAADRFIELDKNAQLFPSI